VTAARENSLRQCFFTICKYLAPVLAAALVWHEGDWPVAIACRFVLCASGLFTGSINSSARRAVSRSALDVDAGYVAFPKGSVDRRDVG
jgi:hypothetical protein